MPPTPSDRQHRSPGAARLPRRSTTASLLCVSLWCIGSLPVGAETVLLADGRTLTNVSLKAGPAADQVSIDRGAEGKLTLGKDEILVVDFGKTTGKAPAPALRLLNGDQFIGKVSFPAGRQVKVGTGWGSVTLPFAWCGALRLADKLPLPAQGSRDAVVLSNGDKAEGEILEVKNEKVFLRINEATTVPIDLERVRAMSFARAEAPVDSVAGLQVVLDLGAGERMTARWLGLHGDDLKVQPAWGGTIDIPLAALSRLEVKNGKLVYLSDLKTIEALQVPYIEGDYPHRLNESVGGRPIRIAGRSYRRGIGVHARSALKFALDSKFKTFTAALGVDTEVGTYGSVVFRVFGDDRQLFESPIVRGGDQPIELSLEVTGIQFLRLEVDFADNGDVADHANWADARLLRP